MADSRTWCPDPRLTEALRTALAGQHAAEPFAVAVSGGADSAMLAVHAARLARGEGSALRLFHVHHGLQDAADDWADHVGTLADLLSVPLDAVRVAVDTATGLGVEASAREARYAALAELAQRHDTPTLLLAHHRHDQAETLLLRLLRGTGLDGMTGMAAQMQRDGVCYLRPWLDIDRDLILAQAQAWADATGWHAVADPSNADARYARGAVRTLLAPALDRRWPSWRHSLARHARQAAETALILDEVAQADFAGLDPSEEGDSFALAAWRQLRPSRQALVLRHWFRQHGVAMPTEAKLLELMRQLRQLHAFGADRQMRVVHDHVQVCCVGGRVTLATRSSR